MTSFYLVLNRGNGDVSPDLMEREHIYKKSFLVQETAFSLATRLQETRKIPMGRNHRCPWY
jgi:hypothetical protein